MRDSRSLIASLLLASVSLLGSYGVDAQQPASGGGDESGEITVVQRTPDERMEVARPKATMQVGFPDELLLSPPSDEQVLKASRFIQGAIEAEMPLNLVLGRPKILQLAAVPLRLYVPDDDVVRTEIIDQQSGREIALTGLKAGSTTLVFWFPDATSRSGQTTVSYLVRVYEDPLLARPIEAVEEDLNLAFPNSHIELSQIQDRMIVRGQTPSIAEMSQILQVLMGTRGEQRGSNAAPIAEDRPRLGEITNFQADVKARQIDGIVSEKSQVLDPIALARSGIINQLEVAGEQQVMLKVTVAEVNRSAARSIGLNFGIADNSGFTVFESLVGTSGANGISGNILASLDMGQVRLAIDALRRMNLSKTLAEPNLITMNGQTADFQAGGRFPVPILSSGGNAQNLQGVTFIPFGVSLEFTPIIRDRDIITLQLNAEVSTRDESLGAVLGAGGGGGGTQVSGLNSRNFSTSVQLRSGQTIAVAGLLQTNYGASSDRVPFWGDLPIIGATGGMNRTSGGEQELVILVTPHLVAPANDVSEYALPGDDVSEPTDIEFYIANRLESRRTNSYRASVRTDHARQKQGERCTMDKFMIGSVGPSYHFTPRNRKKPHEAIVVNKKESPGIPSPVIIANPLED
ncbi:MAG: pilus assembly protein N-terminal domain-containing protein [Rubripirellula sp.]|nr:pilus assembly protein N-terminal domain-containing protein [Rubripirellula sp.]